MSQTAEAGPTWIDKRALAAHLGCSMTTVNGLLKRGAPHLKVGGKIVRFRAAEVEGWLRAAKRAKPAP